MSNWFEWKDEDLKELGIKGFQFFDYLKEELQPHTRYDYQPIDCPEEHHEYYHKSDRLDEISRLLKKFDGFAKEGGETKRYIDYGNPLYFDFLKLCGYQFGTYMNDSWRLHISSKDIENLKKERKREYSRIEKEMDAIRIDDKETRSWKYLVLPSTKEECDKLKSELTEGNIFKKDIALEIKRKFEAGKGKEVTSTGIDSQELADLKKEELLKDPELMKVIKEVKPEMEFLYNELQELVGFRYDNNPDREKRLQEEAESMLANSKNKFAYLKKEYFKDKKIYSTDPKQTPRDFIGPLLKKIVKDQTGKRIGGHTLYKIYKNI